MEANPLKKYFRQPKVYITLPSKGKFYTDGTLNLPENGELPVYAMTARDELTMKTPDALLNGQATVEMIKSCIPSIVDPWQMPSIDLDASLIAIRIATYGDDMEITTKEPGTGEDKTFGVDLRQMLNKLVTVEYENVVTINDMQVTIRPLSYREFTDSSLKTFEEQRIFALVNDETMPDEEKLGKFNQSFKKLTDLTITVLAKSIHSIQIGDTIVSDREHIDEFIKNTDKEFFKFITDHLDIQRAKFSLEPIQVKSSKEDIEAGAPAEWEIPITFDQSNFFA
jgi:hypothetical protein|tara:strand:+ start:4609 stop:5454 length:846 start_codon:yes stop_codon:yes gene_type:complete